MKELIKRAKYMIDSQKVKKISDNLFEIEENSVSLVKKKGRQLLLCTCKNSTDFCNESPICSHKIAVIIYQATYNLRDYIEKEIKELEQFKKINMKPEIDSHIHKLNHIKRLG